MPGSAARLTALFRALLIAFAPAAALWLRSRYRREGGADGGVR